MVVTQYHANHPEGLVCPRCGKSTIVLHGESTYVCLDHQCGFRHDVSDNKGGPLGSFMATVCGLLVLLVFL